MSITVPKIINLKNQRPIVALTAYNAQFAEILDAYVDILLVGDSLGMVVYGAPSTLSVTVEDIIRHTRAVASVAKNALVVADLPFGSYQQSPKQAFATAAQIMAQTNCGAVKLEGGAEMAPTIEFLTKRCIPVIAHIGLMPQSVHVLGGYKRQGKTSESADKLRQDAKTLDAAGAFAIVLECVEAEIAAQISAEIKIPTIGIGSGNQCDGQVLVTEDMAGLSAHTASFVKKYTDLRQNLSAAVQLYADEVRARKFPL